MYSIPKWRGYRIRTEVVEVDDNGAVTNRLRRVPLAELAQWDAEHDEAGNLRRRRVGDSDDAASRTEEKVTAGVKV